METTISTTVTTTVIKRDLKHIPAQALIIFVFMERERRS